MVQSGVDARLLCVFVVFCTVINNFADGARVGASCVLRLIGVVGGCSRRRLLTGFSKRSFRVCDAVGLSVMLGF